MHKVQVKGILSAKNGMNVYRGCTHGCIYCDARRTSRSRKMLPSCLKRLSAPSGGAV